MPAKARDWISLKEMGDLVMADWYFEHLCAKGDVALLGLFSLSVMSFYINQGIVQVSN